MSPCIAIIVLNWNQCDLTLECLHSLAALDYSPDQMQIVLVDNASTDGTVQAVSGRFPHVIVLQNETNLGYAGGNNVGIRYALERGAEYVCILNNDVTVSPDFLTRLVDCLQVNLSDGVATPLVADMAVPERVWALGAVVDWRTGMVNRLHTGENVSALRSAEPFEVDIAPGAAMLVSREVFERVGGFDEAFYLYYEESDWCLRVRQAGYRILAVPASVVWHKVSATLGQTSPIIDYYMLRNHLRFIIRHWYGAARYRLLVSVLLLDLGTIATYTLKSHRGRRLPHRDARLFALRDAFLGRWGKMGADVAAVCDGLKG